MESQAGGNKDDGSSHTRTAGTTEPWSCHFAMSAEDFPDLSSPEKQECLGGTDSLNLLNFMSIISLCSWKHETSLCRLC